MAKALVASQIKHCKHKLHRPCQFHPYRRHEAAPWSHPKRLMAISGQDCPDGLRSGKVYLGSGDDIAKDECLEMTNWKRAGHVLQSHLDWKKWKDVGYDMARRTEFSYIKDTTVTMKASPACQFHNDI